jgi:hypothetical protein
MSTTESNAIIQDYQNSKMRLEQELEIRTKELDELKELCCELRMRVVEEGANPAWHRRILTKHTTEWPYLWASIRKIMDKVSPESERTGNASYSAN